MAAHEWRESLAIRDSLTQYGHQYGFFQAIRLLMPPRDDEEDEIVVLDKAMEFDTEIGHRFPTNEIQQIEQNDEHFEIKVSTFGLGGPMGPLPAHHSDWIYDEYRHGNKALKAFIKIFDHRLISLLYLIKQRNLFGLHYGNRSSSDLYRYLGNISGLIKNHADKTTVRHPRLLPFSGLLAGGRTHVPAVTHVLSEMLQTDVKLESLKGEFVHIDSGFQARLTAFGHAKNPQRQSLSRPLGDSLILGHRVWRQAHGIELTIGPVTCDTCKDWQPGHSGHEELCQILQYVTGEQWVLHLRVLVTNKTIPMSTFDQGMRLGTSSWLKSQEDNEGISETRYVIKPRHMH